MFAHIFFSSLRNIKLKYLLPKNDMKKHFVQKMKSKTVKSILPCTSMFLLFFDCRFGHSAKLFHFTGAVKPWSSSSFKNKDQPHCTDHFVSLWWKEYLSHTTSSPPEKDFHQNVEQPKQVATFRKAISFWLLHRPNSFRCLWRSYYLWNLIKEKENIAALKG